MMRKILIALCWLPFGGLAQGYFQQRVDHVIDVQFDHEAEKLHGFDSMTYVNESPDTLHEIYMHLWPNAYQGDHTALGQQMLENRDTYLHFYEEVRGSIDSIAFTVNGVNVDYEEVDRNPDVVRFDLPRPLWPGDSISIETPFRVHLPDGRISRLGVLNNSVMATQWYPKPAVFDRDGWHPMPYLTQGEFYSEFGAFDVTVHVDTSYTLAATGRPVSHSVDGAKQTFRFRQDSIHDFAWFADQRWQVLHDSVQLPWSDRWVHTWAYYTPRNETLWQSASEYLKDATYYYSLWNGDYPYEHVIAVDGTIAAGGGMEYPMITIIGNMGSARGLETVIMHEVGHNWFYGILGSNERDHAWMDEGINTANEIRYIKTKYPEREIFDIDSRLIDKIKKWFDLEGYDVFDANYLPYLFSARFGVDQAIETPSDEFNSLNYGAIVYSKTGLVFEYLRHYWGDTLYDAAMREYYDQWQFKHPQPNDLRTVLEDVSGESLDWLFEDLIESNLQVDYKVKKVSKGALTARNRTQLQVPYSTSLLKDGREVERIWMPPMAGDTTWSLPDVDYDAVRIDAPEELIEEFRHNNLWRSEGLLKKVEPIKLQFYGSLDRPENTQIYWSPILSWNNYDKFLVGFAVYNANVPVKPFQYRITPMYSIEQGTLNGAGQSTLTKYFDDGIFQFIRLGVYGRHFSYDTDLTYTRLTTALNIQFRRPYPRSPYSHSLRVRNVSVWRELPTISEPPIIVDLSNSNYSILDVRYRLDNQHVLHPWQVFFDTQFATGFVKSYVDATFQWQIRKGSRLQWRNYLGWFWRNEYPSNGSYYNFRLSNTPDYLFELYFLGRSEDDGFLSRQFFVQDGGLKYDTRSTVNAFLASSTVQYPIWRFFQVYVEGAYTSNQFSTGPNENQFHYGAGFSLRFIPDFVELYFPVAYGNTEEGFRDGVNPFGDFRFVLDLRLDEIYRRLSQGLY